MKSTLCFLNNGPFRILFNIHLLTVWNRQEWNTEFNIDPSQSTVSTQPIISTNAHPEWLQSQNTGQNKQTKQNHMKTSKQWFDFVTSGV